ncbi:hypothetical protein S40288_05976 [Stachybotrys chartarum IBT 40288]|nr:hypothetical protein S40288_05976 [Stachybotrys chartarum IBT 40288]
MKAAFVLLAAAASLTQVAATRRGGFHNAPPFTCPGNTDNVCEDKQREGWNWQDLTPGPVREYDGFNFNGWTCENEFSRRDPLAPRTSRGGKVISGRCGQEPSTAPSFECGERRSRKDFSVKKFHITVEFDCRMEFHYDMPDGSVCRQSQDCSTGGTTVHNTQCGGAKKVRFVYPEQPNMPKRDCHVGIGHIDFDCDNNTPPKSTSSTIALPSSTSPVSTLPVEVTTTPSLPEVPTSVPIPVDSTTVSVPEDSTTISIPAESTTPSLPVESTTVSVPGESTTIPVPEDSTSVPVPEVPTSDVETPEPTPSTPGATTTPSVPEVPITTPGPEDSTTPTPEDSTTPVPEDSTTPVVPEVPTSAVETTQSSELPVVSTPTTPPAETTFTTTYDTTSTVFTTSVQTITSCAPEIPDCPADGTTAIVTVTVPISTTICPVTETLTAIPSQTPGVPSTPDVPEGGDESPETPETPEQPETPETPETPEQPEDDDEEIPCPDVVPQCLNTFFHLVKTCRDNLDSECYCPNGEFVDEVFKCLYAHGQTDDIIAEAVNFFQGVCAPSIPENPAIITGADSITEHITVTGTTIASTMTYTTIVVEATVTEPCVTDGSTIPGSSTTVTLSTEVTVPQVTLPTAPATVPGAEPTAPGAVAPAPTSTLFTSRPPAGTGGFVPTPSVTPGVPIAAANNVRAGFGLGLVVMVAAALL